MKNFTILGIILLSLIFTACEDSSVDPEAVSKHGNYFPLSVGSWWEYHYEGMDGFPSDTVRTDIVNTIVDTKDVTWYSIMTTGSQQYVFYRYEGDNLYFQDGKVILKKNLIKGDSWSYATVDYPTAVYDTVRVLDVGMELSIFGNDYTNVAQVVVIYDHYYKGESKIRNETNYFYAKGIGLIQTISPYGRKISIIDYHVED
ncbi:MAG: hypothetical protein PF588_08135 [Candidatus Kapabacteria bacterium]|jgi:hypothetical protein|nr:hypothetical protein [Candidatus Kapabacteria bacterium]